MGKFLAISRIVRVNSASSILSAQCSNPQWAFRQSAEEKDDFEGGKMKALSAPQTAMRHHSQRGPTDRGKAAQRHSMRGERIPRNRERKARRLKLFYLGGLESALKTEF